LQLWLWLKIKLQLLWQNFTKYRKLETSSSFKIKFSTYRFYLQFLNFFQFFFFAFCYFLKILIFIELLRCGVTAIASAAVARIFSCRPEYASPWNMNFGQFMENNFYKHKHMFWLWECRGWSNQSLFFLQWAFVLVFVFFLLIW
jgi:hypothetical protein